MVLSPKRRILISLSLICTWPTSTDPASATHCHQPLLWQEGPIGSFSHTKLFVDAGFCSCGTIRKSPFRGQTSLETSSNSQPHPSTWLHSTCPKGNPICYHGLLGVGLQPQNEILEDKGWTWFVQFWILGIKREWQSSRSHLVYEWDRWVPKHDFTTVENH